MTALERIREIEGQKAFGCPTCEGQIPFLLRAFQAMREIAITNASLYAKQKGYLLSDQQLIENTDEKFEEAMASEEKRT